MKSRLVILQFIILTSCSLLATNATNQCDKLLHYCNQFKTHCSPDMITLKSLVSHGQTHFFFYIGVGNFFLPLYKRKKLVWPHETIKSCCHLASLPFSK